MRAARRFLEDGDKVKFTVRFRGREIAHPQKAREQLDWMIGELEDLANVEMSSTMEGRTMTMLVAPKPAVLQQLAVTRAAAERERVQAQEERLAAKRRGEVVPDEPPPPPPPEPEPEDDDDDDDDDGEDGEDGK
jgi:translation initiation factor IF-3